ncbi:MAG: SlyX family protein [Opitutales bacterium]
MLGNQDGSGDEVAGRLQRLEERIAFLERHNEAQDKALWAADREVVKLAGEVRLLRQRLASFGNDGPGEDASAMPERPPHY